MLFNNKKVNSQTNIKTALLDARELELFPNEIRIANNNNVAINISIILPYDGDHIVVETVGLYDIEIGCNLVGKLSQENLKKFVGLYYPKTFVSVGELTRRENTVVKYTELLRVSEPTSHWYSQISMLERLNLFSLDYICKSALIKFLCNRIYVDEQYYYRLS